LSLKCSSTTAATEILRKNTVYVGKCTVCSILKKGRLIINKNSVTSVCIDYFALIKRESYGTIMVGIKTHRIIDMINSREYEAVRDWLKTYPNLCIAI